MTRAMSAVAELFCWVTLTTLAGTDVRKDSKKQKQWLYNLIEWTQLTPQELLAEDVYRFVQSRMVKRRRYLDNRMAWERTDRLCIINSTVHGFELAVIRKFTRHASSL